MLSQVNVEPSTLTVDTLDRLARAAMVLDPEALRSSLSAELDGALDRISEQLVALDPGLQRALERTRKTVSFAFGRLAQRVGRAQLRDDQEQNRRLKVLQNFLLPNRSRQERTVGIARYMARFGWEELKRALRNADDPGPGCFTAVEPLPIPTGGRL
ncbi:MAG: bacillithiol biosynthesis BshC [Myxococcota bacterium]